MNAITKHEAARMAAEKYTREVEIRTVAYLSELVGPERVREAVARFQLSFRVAAAAAPQLREAPVSAVAEAIALCALTDLKPGGPLPDCYLIPRKSKNPQTGQWDIPGLQWMISFRGLRKLAERSGVDLEAVPVFRGEDFTVRRGLTPTLEHNPDYMGTVARTWDNLALVYVVARHRNGRPPTFEVVSRHDIERRRDNSDAYKRQKSGPWIDWPVEMALKTAIRYAISRGLVPLDEVGQVAFDADGKQDAIEVIDAPPVVDARQLTSNPTGSDAVRARLEELQGSAPANPPPPRDRDAEAEKEAEKAQRRALVDECTTLEKRFDSDGVRSFRDAAVIDRTGSLGRLGAAKLTTYRDLMAGAAAAIEPAADDLPFSDDDE